MKNRTFKPCFLVVTLVPFFLAYTSAEAFTVRTIGSFTCDEWSVDRQKEESSEKSENISLDWLGVSLKQRWMMGMITALNFTGANNKDVLHGVNGNLISDWTDMYCAKNPEDDGFDATIALFKKLSK